MEKLNANIIFKNGEYFITNTECPGFLASYCFQDEYEANLAWAVWLQYSKITKRNTNFAPYQWIFKAVVRVIGIPSKWSE